MKLYRILSVFLYTVICVLWIQISFAQTNPEIKALDERISRLEGYKIDISTQADARAETLKNQVEKDLAEGLQEIEDSKETLDLLLKLGIPITIGSFLIGYFSIIYFIKKLVTTRISSIIEKKRDDIIRLVETETFDNKLRNTKVILVISADEDGSEKIGMFLRKLKFKKVLCRTIGSFTELPIHDLMVFNMPEGELSQQQVDQLIAMNDDVDTHFVAYSKDRLNPNDRLNFSNSSFTLYHNILSTLKYSEVVKLIENEDNKLQ